MFEISNADGELARKLGHLISSRQTAHRRAAALRTEPARDLCSIQVGTF